VDKSRTATPSPAVRWNEESKTCPRLEKCMHGHLTQCICLSLRRPCMVVRRMSRFPDLVDKLRTAPPPRRSGGTKHPKLVPVWKNVYIGTRPNVYVYHSEGHAWPSAKCPYFQIPWTNYEHPTLPGGPVAQSIQNLSPFGKMYAYIF